MEIAVKGLIAILWKIRKFMAVDSGDKSAFGLDDAPSRRSGSKRCEAAQRIFRETRRWREADAVGRRCACGRQNAPVIATNVLLRSPLDNDARRSGRLGDASASERATLPYVVLCEME